MAKKKAPAKAEAPDAAPPAPVDTPLEEAIAAAPPPPPAVAVAPVESLEARVADLEDRLRNVDGKKPLYKR